MLVLSLALLVCVCTAVPACWKVVEIPRIHAKDVSISEFYSTYSETPVIIQGVAESFTQQWSFDFLKEKCPMAQIPVMKTSNNSEVWAHLEFVGNQQLQEFIRYMFEQSSQDEQKLYGFDLLIREQCPALIPYFKVPRYFNECLLQAGLVKDHFTKVFETAVFAWPSMMVGPQGSSSALHLDNQGLPFWMTLFEGRKHWRVLPYKANYHLTGKEVNDEFQPPAHGDEFRGSVLEEYYGGGTFNFDVFDPDFKEFPELCKAEVHEGILEKGEIMYIPNSAPHGVINLNHTIAITSNYFSPFDRAQIRWLEKNCEVKDAEDRGFSPTICSYLFDRISFRKNNRGPPDDLLLTDVDDPEYFKQNFEKLYQQTGEKSPKSEL